MIPPPEGPGRLAVVGAGSSGLISLHYALRRLPGWDVVGFEKSGSTTGAWGDPYPGFVSTTTKYTTQFACHRRFEATAKPGGEAEREEFFRDGEYGAYLDSFVEEKGLGPHIRRCCAVQKIEKAGSRWRLTLSGAETSQEDFDAVILATGLAERPKEIRCPIEQLTGLDEERLVTGKTVVVVGGGESAVDMANRLAAPDLGNRVFLSLKSGIRVSPRYHPIRGVPSDFLRTRLMLSIDEGLRNAIGQKFVEARIKHQELFERLSRRKTRKREEPSGVRERRKYWAAKLTERAKDSLFNMFHNKSDDFLDAVAEGRLHIVGPPVDESYRIYKDFEGGEPHEIAPDLLVPMIGFTSEIEELTGGEARPEDFYLGCVHAEHEGLFLVGFARPVIGNIPTISEMQAQYVTGLLAGRHRRPADLPAAHRRERHRLQRTFPKIATDQLLPVEMFPYCDRLAKEMGTFPTLRRAGSLRSWWKTWLAPASTSQYVDESYDASFVRRQRIHAPPVIIVLLLLVKALDLALTPFRREPVAAGENPPSPEP